MIALLLLLLTGATVGLLWLNLSALVLVMRFGRAAEQDIVPPARRR